MATETTDGRRVWDFHGFPGRWEILATSEDTDGERFETRMEIREPGELPPHKHPRATESYEVLSGTLEVLEDGTWFEISAGDTHEVPPGTSHAFRAEGPVEVINTHRPAMRYEEYFRRFHRLKVEAGVQMPPRSLDGMIKLGMLQSEYEPEFIGVRPPQWAYRALAWLGSVLRRELPE